MKHVKGKSERLYAMREGKAEDIEIQIRGILVDMMCTIGICT